MPTRFVSTQQMKAECQSSNADLLLAPSLALFSISESSEVVDVSYRGSWGNACSRKSYRSNLSSLGDLSSFGQSTVQQSSRQEAIPQSPTTSMDDGSWGFFQLDGYIVILASLPKLRQYRMHTLRTSSTTTKPNRLLLSCKSCKYAQTIHSKLHFYFKHFSLDQSLIQGFECQLHACLVWIGLHTKAIAIEKPSYCTSSGLLSLTLP